MNADANNSYRDVPDAALRQNIEERAYYIWLASGRGHGDHERQWFEAERELMETAKQERDSDPVVAGERKPVNRINHSDKFMYEESTNEGERDMSRTIKANKEAAIDEAITRRESQMTYDNEAVVRNAYHTAEGNVLDIPGWIGSLTEDGVFNNVSGEASYRGEHL